MIITYNSEAIEDRDVIGYQTNQIASSRFCGEYIGVAQRKHMIVD